MCVFKRDWIATSNFINYSTFNNEHNWKDYASNSIINKHALLINIIE